jgi:hypothetical protein
MHEGMEGGRRCKLRLVRICCKVGGVRRWNGSKESGTEGRYIWVNARYGWTIRKVWLDWMADMAGLEGSMVGLDGRCSCTGGQVYLD